MGFLSKEYMYKALLEANTYVLVLLLVVNALMVSLALSLILKPFLSKAGANHKHAKPIEHNVMLWIPPALLALGSLVVPVLALSWLNENIVTPGVNTVAPQVVAQDVKLWQGVNLPLVLSGITLALGVLFYKLSATYHDWWGKTSFKLPVADDMFYKVMAGLVSVAKWQTQRLQHTRLGGYALTSFLVLALLLLSQLSIENLHWPTVAAQFTSLEAVIALVMMASVGLCIVATSSYSPSLH